MPKQRLEAFSDAVIAIIITIMVLELIPPLGNNFSDLSTLINSFVVYILSYFFVAVLWINHHHLISIVRNATGQLLWINMMFLFFISLVPFCTIWVAQSDFSSAPVFLYGVNFLIIGILYGVLHRIITKDYSDDFMLKQMNKIRFTTVIHLIGISLAFFLPVIAFLFYITTVIMWIIPDKGFEINQK